MFQQMFSGVGQGPFSGGHGANIWRSFLTDEYSKSFVKAGGIGIAAAGARANCWRSRRSDEHRSRAAAEAASPVRSPARPRARR